jgi:hypothetical protein
MTHQARSSRSATSALLPVATAAVAASIFAADILTPPDVVVSGLYVLVVLMASRFCRPSGIVLAAAGCIGLVLAAYFLSAETAINAAIPIPAIGAAAFLALQSKLAEATLREQASLLNLTHDTIIARGFEDDVITYKAVGSPPDGAGPRAKSRWRALERLGSHERLIGPALDLAQAVFGFPDHFFDSRHCRFVMDEITKSPIAL